MNSRKAESSLRAHFVFASLATAAVACSGQAFEGASSDPQMGGQSPSAPHPGAGAQAPLIGSGGATSPGVEGGAAGSDEPVEGGAGGSDEPAVGAGGEVVIGAGGEPGVVVTAAGGAGGAGEPPLPVFELIDDMEVGFPQMPQVQGRNGYWFVANDQTAPPLSAPLAFPLDPPRQDSHFAAHVSGAGFTDWGAMIGATLRSPFAGYDASAYCGVHFLAKGSGEGWALRVSDKKSEPDGGICGGGFPCYNHLGQEFQPAGDWQEHEIYFDELELTTPDGWSPRPLEVTALYALQFVFTNASGAAFELFIDDLSFIPAEACR